MKQDKSLNHNANLALEQNSDQSLTQRYDSIIMLVPRLLSEKRTDLVTRLINSLLPPDIAQLLSELERPQAQQVFALLDTAKAAETLDELDDADLANALLESLHRDSVRGLLDNMSDDALAGLLRDLDANKAERFLNVLLAEDAQSLRKIIRQGAGTAGAIMTTAYLAATRNHSVTDTLQLIREQAAELETINYIYVLDEEQKLVGVLSLRDMLFAPRETLLQDIMTLDPVAVTLGSSQEEAAQLIRRFSLQALPVVDTDTIMQGIITFDDALDVLEEEGDVDLYQLARIATKPEDSEDLLLRLPPLQAALKRLPWLIICIFGDMVTSSVVRSFEHVLSQMVVLIFFMPVLLDSAGSIGTQSLAIVVRGLASGQFSTKIFLKQLWRESHAGVMLGIACGVSIGGVAILWQGNYLIGVAVGSAMCVGMAVSTVIGMTIPLFIHKMKMDPALASGPVITTLADMFTLYVYFRVASSLLDLAV